MEMNTGARLRRSRTKLGLTQEEVAEFLGVRKQYVSKWETGTNQPAVWKHLAGLARRYNVSADWLLDLSNEERPLVAANGAASPPRAMPFEADELLDYWMGMTARGRDALLTVAGALADLDGRWREREQLTMAAIQWEQPGELDQFADTIRRVGGPEAALRILREWLEGLGRQQ